ncbi:MAG: hypothetical protein COB02_14670 [Candidatus Cloacimonadota bacterium]|nr:MAG: hypothetical protein COB02_14670 [Candidatus Cloacimonadota bacterium]
MNLGNETYMKIYLLALILFINQTSSTEDFYEGLNAPNASVQKEINSPANILNSINSLNPFITVQSGSFYMGAHYDHEDDKKPLHQKSVRMIYWNKNTGRKIRSEKFYHKLRQKVQVKNKFELGKHEVTQKFFKKIMGKNPSKYKGDLRPVENLTLYQINQFLKKLNKIDKRYNYRLPTAKEWEYAYRAGEESYFFFKNLDGYKSATGNSYIASPDIGQLLYGWLFNNTSQKKILLKHGGDSEFLGQHQRVGLKSANAWGFYDMVGNVSERTSTKFKLPKSIRWLDKQGNPTSLDLGGYSSMGGSYINYPTYINIRNSRSSKGSPTYAAFPGERASIHPFQKSSTQGFRLVRQAK